MSQITIKYYIMKTLWEKLSEEHRHKLLIRDVEFGDKYWEKLLNTPDMLINDIRINDWFLLQDDLRFKTINEAYHHMFNS